MAKSTQCEKDFRPTLVDLQTPICPDCRNKMALKEDAKNNKPQATVKVYENNPPQYKGGQPAQNRGNQSQQRGNNNQRPNQQARGGKNQAHQSAEIYYKGEFFNPYNFARFGTVGTEGTILGKCRPPHHDRYAGLSGEITCKAKVVTPLFISDSHNVTVDANGHRTYEFFNVQGERYIPASSLRGMIRSVFETVTQSCLAIFDNEAHLYYRMPAGDSNKLIPARIEKDAQGNLAVRLLNGTTAFADRQNRNNKQYAALITSYKKDTTVNRMPVEGGKPLELPIKRSEFTNVKLYAVLEADTFAWKVKLLTRDKKTAENRQESIKRAIEAAKKKNIEVKIVSGWLHYTGDNMNRKRSERLFFAMDDKPAVLLKLDESVKKEWRDRIEEIQERHAEDIKERKKSGWRPKGNDNPELSHYITNPDTKNLKEGDLVYAMTEPLGRKVTALYPVTIPRCLQPSAVHELLPKEYKTCIDANKLCPACRVFGWVKDGREAEEQVAYKSRVKVSVGSITKDQGVFADTTLAILGSPKPTAARFYLVNKQGKALEGIDIDSCRYNKSHNLLRGRKLYRHHGNFAPRVYSSSNKSNQNRTIRKALNAESEFSFKVKFDNLSPIELGALLWSLELPDGCHHRLGYAKPLGFGSLKVTIDTDKTSHIIKPQERYSSFSEHAEQALSKEDVQKWKEVFVSALQELHGKEITQLGHIQDLLVILQKASLPIHYPKRDNVDGENFRWFVANESGHGKKAALALAAEDKGLPMY